MHAMMRHPRIDRLGFDHGIQRFKIERYIFPSQQVDEVNHTIGKVCFGNTTHRFTFFLTIF